MNNNEKLKIAIIDSSDTWYAQPKLIYNELIQMGHEVLFLGQPNHLGYKKSYIPPEFVSICIANNLSPIDVFTDKKMELNHPPLERAYYSTADLIFVGDKTTFLRFFSGRTNSYYMPYAVNHVFKPIEVDLKYDVSFIGNLKFKERIRRIELLRKRFNIFVSNNSFMDEANLLMNQSKIIFNTCDGKEINMRVFEALGTGRLLVTEKVDYLDELFIDKKHLITYSDDEQLIEKLEYYLANDLERESIAKAGNLELKKNHTYKKRAEFIVEKILQLDISYSHKKSVHLQNRKDYQNFYEKQSKINKTAQERIFDFSLPDPDSDGKYDIRSRLSEAMKVAKGKVLDIGCQRGGYSFNLKKIGLDVTAIDISLGYVKQAKAKVKDLKSAQADTEFLPFKNETFDTIILSEILEHVTSEKKVVKEIYRLLKDNGLVYVTVPAYDDDTEEHVRFLRKSDLKMLFSDFQVKFNDIYKLKSTIMIATKIDKDKKMENQYNSYKKLKVLLTNHHLLDYTGSEVYTLAIAKYLKQNNCDVVVYSRYVDKIEKDFKDLEIPVVNHLEEIKKIQFDIAHVHHNINAAEVRLFFPELPIVFLSHGVLPFLEQASVFELGISNYLAVSDEVKINLVNSGIDENKISVIGNIIDTEHLITDQDIKSYPKQILVISAKLNVEKEKIIRAACDILKINVKFVGGRFGEINQVQLFKNINESDIIISLGRGIIEAVLSKRAAIVFDSNGGDGLITLYNYEEISKNNFSGRRFNKHFTAEELVEEIKKYNPNEINKLYQIFIEKYSAAVVVPKLVESYREIILNHDIASVRINQKTLTSFYSSLQETKNYTTILTERKLAGNDKIKNDIYLSEFESKIDYNIDLLLSKIKNQKRDLSTEGIQYPNYDILIPIYNAYDKVKNCVESVIKYTDKKHKIYLLDDASPDSKIFPLLQDFAKVDERVIALSSEKNLGFIGNMNRGFSLSNNDVIILNSDTQVTKNWIEKLHHCILSDPKAGIASPLSNNATILSVPEMNASNKLPDNISVDDFARIVEDVSLRTYPELPTAVGFCMLIKRTVLDEIGFFDPIFGLGYGEENDFCERAKQNGFKILCSDDTYVHHYGEASFSFVDKIQDKRIVNQKILDERWPNYKREIFSFCRANPLREIQERIYHKLNYSEKKQILFVMHSFNAPGGTELHTRKIIDGLSSDYNSTVIYPESLGYLYSDAVTIKTIDYLREIKVAKENNLAIEHFGGLPADLNSSIIEQNFARFLIGGNYDIVHFQHLSNWSTLTLPLIAKKLGKKIIISLHDFYFLCPELNLIYSYTNNRCGKNIADPDDSTCQYCLGTKRYNRIPEKAQPLGKYLSERNRIIKTILEISDSVIVPSEFVMQKFLHQYNAALKDKISIVPHGIEKIDRIEKFPVNKKFKVTFLGNATDRKGINVFIDAIKKVKSQDFEFEVLGFASEELKKKCKELKINFKGAYHIKELSSLLLKTDLVLLASIVDETFSLTLSEAMMAAVPVLASNVGALNERIIDGKNGFLFTSGSSSSIAERLIYLKDNAQLLTEVRINLANHSIKTIEENIVDYKNIYQSLIDLSQNQSFNHKPTKEQSPRVSIIVPIYNQANYSMEFLSSLIQKTKLDYEIIIIDNASSDNSANLIQEKYPQVIIIRNENNYGFPQAINQGIQVSRGRYILIANNDIVLTQNWLERLIEIAETDSKIGIVGPISNEVSGVQKDKDANYKTIDEMHLYAATVRSKNKNKITHFPRVAFLCTLIKREVINKIGGLDERFSPGNFEDDDFCLRAQLAGFKTVIAYDVFIHHYGSKSFKADGEKKYIDRLKTNLKIFVDKWNADPDEIWLKGKPFNQKRSLFISVNKDEFLKCFERAHKNIEDKEYGLALNSLELALCEFDKSDAAISIMQKIDLLMLTANVSLILKDLESAKNYFEETLKLNPSSSDACFGLGQVFYQAEMFEQSKTMFEWAVKNNSRNQKAIDALKLVNQNLSLPENHNSLFENEMIPVESES